MVTAVAQFRKFYGAHPLHLLTMVAGFALVGYAVVTVTPVALWNPDIWWQSIAVWFVAAVIAHDLVLFPIYALVDRTLTAPERVRRPHRVPVPVLNYLRTPALGAALLFVVFLPGIIEQGAPTYRAATGQTQEPFLGRWLLLTAVLFALSAVCYALRLAMTRRATERSE